jgi:hypothetical protein
VKAAEFLRTVDHSEPLDSCDATESGSLSGLTQDREGSAWDSAAIQVRAYFDTI